MIGQEHIRRLDGGPGGVVLEVSVDVHRGNEIR
jgi:hypothetical protein